MGRYPRSGLGLLLLGAACARCVGLWTPPTENASPPAGAHAGALRLRGGFTGLDYTDRAARQLEKKLGGCDRARRSLVNHGFGGLLDDLDDIAKAIALPGVRVCEVVFLRRRSFSVSTAEGAGVRGRVGEGLGRVVGARRSLCPRNAR
jgi:hypothetical protein